jgi:hypothetical protein
MGPEVLLIQSLVVLPSPMALPLKRFLDFTILFSPDYILRVAFCRNIAPPSARLRIPTTIQELLNPLFGRIGWIAGCGSRGDVGVERDSSRRLQIVWQSRDQVIEAELVRRLIVLQSLWEKVVKIKSTWRIVFFQGSP